MADPFAPSTDPDIPTPTREDLLRLVHGSVRDQLAANILDAKHAATEFEVARRTWDEGHKKDAVRRREEAQEQQEKPQPPPSTGTRVLGSQRAPTEQEERDAELLTFMSPQVRTVYEQSGIEERQIIWEANKQAFEAAKQRKEERLVREQQRLEKVFDLLQRVKEDPSKADLLPPDNPSISELHDWYDRMSQPDRPIPFPTPSEQEIRRDRIRRDIQATGRANPEDIAEEEAEAVRYKLKLEQARERKRLEVESEFLPRKPFPEGSLGEHLLETTSRNRQQAEELLGITERRKRAVHPEEPLPKVSAWDKLWKLTENNFFMGGGVAVALGAYAFLLGGAPRFGFGLLIVAWLVICLSIWRHRFFEHRPKAGEVMANAIVCGMIGVILLVLWRFLTG